ncbi:MAG: hypothetical protein U5L45_25900 [Saprospiraceae bacterium]|nr:hypothetical protein [Saprospiraceae bacterium]
MFLFRKNTEGGQQIILMCNYVDEIPEKRTTFPFFASEASYELSNDNYSIKKRTML